MGPDRTGYSTILRSPTIPELFFPALSNSGRILQFAKMRDSTASSLPRGHGVLRVLHAVQSNHLPTAA
jgi:hypothetical protein